MSECSSKIQLKRGLDADFGGVTLLPGEPAFVIDKGKLYIGEDKVLINPDYGTAASADTGTEEGNVPVLGPDGKLDPTIFPESAGTKVFIVASAEDLTTLEAKVGDIAILADGTESYVLVTEPASTAENWVSISGSEPTVLSVNSKVGAVVLEGQDILIPNYELAAECSGLLTTDSVTTALGKLEYRVINVDGGTFV